MDTRTSAALRAGVDRDIDRLEARDDELLAMRGLGSELKAADAQLALSAVEAPAAAGVSPADILERMGQCGCPGA